MLGSYLYNTLSYSYSGNRGSKLSEEVILLI